MPSSTTQDSGRSAAFQPARLLPSCESIQSCARTAGPAASAAMVRDHNANRFMPHPFALDVFDFDHFVTVFATRRDHVDHVADALGDQRACDRRGYRDAAGLDVGLVLANDLVGDVLAVVLVF